MINLLKAEQAAQLAIAILALYYQPIYFAWWLWPFIFLSPDISMLGYMFSCRVGAAMYNWFHHKLVAGLLIITGFLYPNPVVLFIGLLLWAHSSFDRIMGYGLKYNDSFSHTHLGMIGIKK